MQKIVLITGGFGFLGRVVAKTFKLQGCRVVGIGRGRWGPEEALAHGFDSWLDASVSLSSLMALTDSGSSKSIESHIASEFAKIWRADVRATNAMIGRQTPVSLY